MDVWQYPNELKKTQISIYARKIEIAYVEEGEGDFTLLMIHGLGSNLKSWQKNINNLSLQFRCIAIDLPGYGKSEKKDFPFDMTFFAQAIMSFIKKLKLQNVVLVGHSMGGHIAMLTVLKNPSIFQRLILIAPAGFETFGKKDHEWFNSYFNSSFLMGLSKEQILRNFHINFYKMPSDAQFMIEDRMMMYGTDEYDFFCRMIPRCVMGMLAEPVFDQLSDISLPTLVFFGEEDRLIPNKLLHPLIDTYVVAKNGHLKIQNSILEFLPNAGHFVQWEKANELNKRISEFLVDAKQ